MTDELSIGDYVLTNGVLPAAVVVDAVVRLLPGVLGGGEEGDPGRVLYRGPPGVPSVHASGGLQGHGRAGGAPERQPRGGRRLARPTGVGQDGEAASGLAEVSAGHGTVFEKKE